MFVVYGAANGDLIDAFTGTAATQYVAVMNNPAGSRRSLCQVRASPGCHRDQRAGRG